ATAEAARARDVFAVVLRQRIDEAERLARIIGEMDAAAAFGRAVTVFLAGRWRYLPRRLRLARQRAALLRTGLFDPDWYLRRYDDVAAAGMDPAQHYVEYGAKEGRAP